MLGEGQDLLLPPDPGRRRHARTRRSLVGRSEQDPTNQHRTGATTGLRPRFQLVVPSSCLQSGATPPATNARMPKSARSGDVGRRSRQIEERKSAQAWHINLPGGLVPSRMYRRGYTPPQHEQRRIPGNTANIAGQPITLTGYLCFDARRSSSEAGSRGSRGRNRRSAHAAGRAGS